jgi:hypothetical protein
MAKRGSCNTTPALNAGSEQEGVVRFCPKRSRAGLPPGVHLSGHSLLLTAGGPERSRDREGAVDIKRGPHFFVATLRWRAELDRAATATVS